MRFNTDSPPETPLRRGGSVLGATFVPLGWSAALTLIVAGPWLQSGYLFGTDWPGPRRFDWPTDLAAVSPLLALLSTLSHAMPADLVGKAFVVSVLFGTAYLAFQAAPVETFVPRALASAIYLFNPFVFGRLHYGQLFLLAGYALLPWVALRARILYEQASIRNGLYLALPVTLVGVVSSHLFVASAVAVVVLLWAAIGWAPNKAVFARKSLLGLGAWVLGTSIASAYWVLPLLTGQSSSSDKLASITIADVSTFAAIPDPQLGLLPNLLGLYGFWAEATGRFTSMKAFVPAWPIVLVVVLVVCAVGLLKALQGRNWQPAAWVSGLVVVGLLALFLEMGVSSPVTAWLVEWIDAHIVLYRGMRDAGKWAAILALVYSQLAALGAAAIIGWIKSHRFGGVQADWSVSAATALLLAGSLYYGNGLMFGMHGEIRPSAYPSGWYAADRVLVADPHSSRALFLPWHQYMGMSFVRNQNSVVVSPAPTFFSVQIVASTNPEVGGTVPPSDPDQMTISELVAAGASGQWAQVLAERAIKYVLLAKEADWTSYKYLDQQPGLELVGDYGSIRLYRNSQATEGS
jgi:hypothetical protein